MAALLAALVAGAVAGSPGLAAAEVDLKFSGSVSADLRLTVMEKKLSSDPDAPTVIHRGIERNENRVRSRLSVGLADRARGVAELEFVWYGRSPAATIEDLTHIEDVDPYWLELHAAYVDVYRVLPRLDLRIGRQVVAWGSADKFNPTSNLNSLDYYDPLLFGVALANNMIRADFSFYGDWNLQAVLVPVFRPARLPAYAPLASLSTRRIPIQEDKFREALAGLQEIMPPTGVQTVVVEPELAFNNMQAGTRLSGRLGLFDLGLSYYYGRMPLPQPAAIHDRASGLVEVTLVYPRMHVVGFDTAASLPFLFDLGTWLEVAVFFPQEVTLAVLSERLGGEITMADDGSMLFDGSGRRPTVLSGDPFFKLTFGLDYTWNKHLYTNLQYVHGFVDEFGGGKSVMKAAPAVADEVVGTRLGDYLVAGADIKMFRDRLLLRLFGVVSLREATAVLFPQLSWSVWEATELTAGAFIFLGGPESKFGDPAAGASTVFLKGTVSF